MKGIEMMRSVLLVAAMAAGTAGAAAQETEGGDPADGADVTAALGATRVAGTTDEWTFTMPGYDVTAEVEFVDAAASGTCGESTANGGNNVVWRLYDMDGNDTPETLVIAPNEEATAETNFMMDDWTWTSGSNSYMTRPWQDYLTNITSVIVADGVQSVGDYSFYGLTALTSVSLGSSVTSIGKCAFEGCTSLASIDIPATVTSIGYTAFDDCSALATVSGGSGLTRVAGYAFDRTAWLSSYDDGEVVYIGHVAYTLKDDVSGAVTIDEGTVAIAGSAFISKSITGITLPEGLEYIGEGAFNGCDFLTAVTIPSTVTFIGSGAFMVCSNLSSVTLLPETPPALGRSSDMFSGAEGLPLTTQHFYVGSDDYLAISGDWYSMWADMAENGWQKVGNNNVSTDEAIAKGVSVATASVTLGDETVIYYNFDDAFAAAEAGYKAAEDNNGTELVPTIKLLANVDVGERDYTIGGNSGAWSLALDLNGQTLSGSNIRIFNVNQNGSLAIFDSSTGNTKGSIVSNYSGNNGGAAINVFFGSLTAEGITISGGKLDGITNNSGTVTLTDCTVSGLNGISGYGTFNISGGQFSGTYSAIRLSNGEFNLNTAAGSAPCSISGGESGIYIVGANPFTIGSGVTISGCSNAGIILLSNENTFTALPTFGTGDDKNGIDIWLKDGSKMRFSEGSFTAPAQPITIKLTDVYANEPSADDLPKVFTTGYSSYVKSGSTVIDPATVFAYHDASLYFAVALDDDGEATLVHGVNIAFAEGQTWMTWCDKNTWVKPSGIDVYEITDATPTTITTAQLTDGMIPAYKPLLLKKNDADGLTALFSATPEAPATGYDAATGIVTQALANATFYGATEAVTPSQTTDLTPDDLTFVLKGGAFVHLGDNDGFAQNRCWLALSAPAGARSLAIVTGEATGAVSVKAETEGGDDGWYSLTGRKLERRPHRKGIYLHGGKKIIIK